MPGAMNYIPPPMPGASKTIKPGVQFTPGTFANTAYGNNLSGVFTDPNTGATYRTNGGTGTGTGSGSGSGTGSGSTPSPVNVGDLWQKTGFLDATSGAPLPPPPPMPGPVMPPPAADRSAAESAAYGRARDKVGLETRASLNALNDEMGGRGMLGSTFAATGAARVLSAGQHELGDTNRTQAIEALDRAGQVEDRNYSGALSQRSQDIGLRGQDMGYATASADRTASAQAARRALLERLMTLQSQGGTIY